MPRLTHPTRRSRLCLDAYVQSHAAGMSGTAVAGRSIRVLAVGDSSLTREAMAAILSPARGFHATAASDRSIAMDKLRRERPDVVVLDLGMHPTSGLSFLRKIMAEGPTPVVVCSASTPDGTKTALRALEEGAVELVSKPKLGIRDFLRESAVLLMDSVRAAAAARLPVRAPRSPLASGVGAPLSASPDKVVAIGASTGGAQAMPTILASMPPDCPGILVVQHMPEGFTRAFAGKLDRSCRIEVKEAADGDRVLEGRALLAPGNRHLELRRCSAHYVVSVSDGSLVSRHRPSVDVLFRSVARAAGANAVGVIMTGMGSDGAEGLLEMRRVGAATLAQDEASCVVFGMPREAIDRGAAEEVAPLERLPELMLLRARAGSGRPQRKPAGKGQPA